jgi:hypothetical protein
MKAFMKAVPAFLAAAMLLAMLAIGAGQTEKSTADAATLDQDLYLSGDRPQPMDRPAEAAMKELFEKGIGDPWVGGEPFSSSSGMSDEAKIKTCPLISYQFLGWLNVSTGFIIASDSGSSMRLIPGAGAYPVYGYFEADKMTGIFVDFNSTLLA